MSVTARSRLGRLLRAFGRTRDKTARESTTAHTKTNGPPATGGSDTSDRRVAADLAWAELLTGAEHHSKGRHVRPMPDGPGDTPAGPPHKEDRPAAQDTLRAQLLAQRRLTEVAEAAQELAEFDRFFLTEFRAIVHTVMLAGATFEGASDAVQEAMVLAMARFDQLDKPDAWVRRVAVRIHNRRSTREAQSAGQPPARQPTPDLPEVATTLATPAPADETTTPSPADGTTPPDEVREALQELSPLQRMVMALTFDGYSPTEIAASLDKLPDTVRATLRQARRRLADGLLNRPDQSP